MLVTPLGMLVVAEIFHLRKRLENVWIMLLGGAVEFLCPAIFIGNLFLIRMAAKEADLADSLLRWGKAAFVAEEYPAAAIVLLRMYLGTLADPEDLAPALTVPDPRVRELILANLHRVPSKSVSDVRSSNPQRRKRGRGRSV